MYLTMRTVWLLSVGCLLAIAAPRPATAIGWTAVVAVLVCFDVIAAPSPRSLRIQRSTARAVRLGETTTSTLTVTCTGRRRVTVQVRDAWPPSAGASHERARLTIPPGERRRTRTVLMPTRRGIRPADFVTVRISGPLGLAGRQASLIAPARLRVLPAFTSRRHLPSRLARLREMDGRSAVMVRGSGTEFDSLREYVVGDDVRSIDWRSTARRGEIVVRTWRPERDRRVLIMIDTGRLSAARLGDGPRLDAHIESCLLMAALASRAGDRVEVVALDVAVRAQVRGQSGPALMSALADTLTPLDAELVETDWTLLASTVRSTLSQRALVIVLTALDGADGESPMVHALGAVARDHAVLLASPTDPDLAELRADHASSEAVYTAAAVERDTVELVRMRNRLRRRGIEVVEAEPAAIAPALADAYLMLKAAGRL